MHGAYGRTAAQRWALTFLHFSGLGVGAYVLFGSGRRYIYDLFETEVTYSVSFFSYLVFAVGIIYFLNQVFSTFFIQERKIDWNEASSVGIFVGFSQMMFMILSITKGTLVLYDVLLILLFFLGLWLNSGSEWMRKGWKMNPENKGMLYTGGLFSYSRHINYFGDALMVLAFASLTGNLFAFAIPVILIMKYVWIYIPRLDIYLAEKYPDQFLRYERRTSKFTPFIY